MGEFYVRRYVRRYVVPPGGALVFIRVRKKYWLIPALIMLVVFGGLMVAANESVLLAVQEETWR
jgi:hypothetical protein